MATWEEQKKKRILCVDDEKGVLSALRRMLRPLDVEILTAQDGEQALQIAEQNDLDLIILDLHMPKMDGYAFLDAFQQINDSHTPVVMLTADEDDLQGYAKGCVYFIRKPFMDQYVPNIVQYLIGNLTEAERTLLEPRL